jgi:hypothetical protein
VLLSLVGTVAWSPAAGRPLNVAGTIPTPGVRLPAARDTPATYTRARNQSLHSRIGVETTNRDGFGIGWYGPSEGPAVLLFHLALTYGLEVAHSVSRRLQRRPARR